MEDWGAPAGLSGGSLGLARHVVSPGVRADGIVPRLRVATMLSVCSLQLVRLQPCRMTMVAFGCCIRRRSDHHAVHAGRDCARAGDSQSSRHGPRCSVATFRALLSTSSAAEARRRSTDWPSRRSECADRQSPCHLWHALDCLILLAPGYLRWPRDCIARSMTRQVLGWPILLVIILTVAAPPLA